MSTPADQRPFLSVVTVVFNDAPGLGRTLNSMDAHRDERIEHWIIDGSTDGAVFNSFGRNLPVGTTLVSEPDDGLYDAMNKALDLVNGEHVLFMNAGDVFHEGFSLTPFIKASESSPGVLLGYSVEEWKGCAWLRPGIGHETEALSMPAHQATLYPRSFYKTHQYDLRHPTGADGRYTAEAVREVGATFVPTIVCRFELGGRSTRYDLATLRLRLRESRKPRQMVKLLIKGFLWAALPRTAFYSILASGKYSRLSGPAPLAEHPIALSAQPN